MRKVTFDFWVKKQSELCLGKPYVIDDPLIGDAVRAVHDEARVLVDEAIKDGAFICPFDEMLEGQRQFWLQRASGVDHGNQSR